jgi:DNA repair protein RadA/Sms
MIAKIKTRFVCQECGQESAKWLGKCPSCSSWNSFVEENFSKASEAREKVGFTTITSDKPVTLDEISLDKTPRYRTGIHELDRVLGGGFVPATLALFGGDPGIGKSTLVLQILDQLLKNNLSALYVTGEESKEQIKMRAERLGVTSNVTVVAENSLERILQHADALKPQVLVVDSIQTVFLPHLESAPGSVSQVRECAGKLLYFSKSSLTATILIGHVTKEGAIAGPRILEHMVDVVLYFEGENTGQFRILRTIKNRYGSTNEIGVFEMTAAGLKEVSNPSQVFLRDKAEARPGSCVTAAVEGTRAILTEIQALVTGSGLVNPRRTAIGLDHNRLALLIAVMEKHGGIKLYDQDVYASVAGGFKLNEPASDLAALLSLLSSFKNKALSGHLVAIGEIGLSGEIRPVGQLDKRVQESLKMGYKTLIVPKANKLDAKTAGMEILPVDTVHQAVDLLF